MVGQATSEVPKIRVIWGFPKIMGTLLGLPIKRTIVFGCLYWGSPILGNYHMSYSQRLRKGAYLGECIGFRV